MYQIENLPSDHGQSWLSPVLCSDLLQAVCLYCLMLFKVTLLKSWWSGWFCIDFWVTIISTFDLLVSLLLIAFSNVNKCPCVPEMHTLTGSNDKVDASRATILFMFVLNIWKIIGLYNDGCKKGIDAKSRPH